MQLQYSLIVLELEDVVQRRDDSKPNLYVSITVLPLETRKNHLLNGRGPKWLAGKINYLRDDLSSEFFTVEYEYARSFKSAAIADLRSAGYTVNRNTDIWTVYVIELDPSATSESGAGFMYVGETKKLPEQRFAEHLNRTVNGKTRLFSNVVAKHGKHLRMDLAPKDHFFDKQSSKKAESEWAGHLRTLGYVVKGGH